MALRAEEIEDPGAVDLDRDRVLVLRYQRGDDSAFDELYRRYYPRLQQYCQRRVGDAHASEELAQEAFVRALRAMPRFAGDRRFYPWMTVIAQRLCIDHHRRSARVETVAEVDLGVVEADHDHVFAAVDRDHLSQAMARLAPRHREVLELREQRGWSYHQIARHLDVPMTTVEALLHRARKALKREFLAASTGNRLASIPLLGWLVFRTARLRARVTGKTVTQLAPIAGSAAAGVAAIGLVFSPFASSTPAPALDRPAAAITHVSTAPASYDVSAPVEVPAPAAASAPAAPAAAAPAKLAHPAAAAGPVGIYSGPGATKAAQEANAEQPVQLDLAVVQAGLNPAQTVSDLVNKLPGGKP